MKSYVEKWKTKDIFEASYIYAQGIQFIGLEDTGRYYFFTFDDSPALCEKLSGLYWSGEAEGNIKGFVNSFRTLKDMVFSKKGASK